MGEDRYIQVIVPLKLSWDPVYRVPDGLSVHVGTRVKVRLSGRLVDAVVSAVDVRPDIDESRILPIAGICDGLDPVTPSEIALWRFMADYYMCTAGEVLKCAYPAAKVRSEETASRMRERAAQSRAKMQQSLRDRVTRIENEMRMVESKADEALSRLTDRGVKTREKIIAHRSERLARLAGQLKSAREALERFGAAAVYAAESAETLDATIHSEVLSLLSPSKPLLLKAAFSTRTGIYTDLVRSILAGGHNVLMLVPDIALTQEYESGLQATFGEDRVLVFHSRETTVCRRKIADAMRSRNEARLVVGTRSALFLPFAGLGLIIVDEEQDRSYKQDSPAPRYNARDCAVMLAKIHSVPVILGSASPSLESEYNRLNGRYAWLDRSIARAPGELLEIIDIPAEKRKNGMLGQYSRKLLGAIDEAAAAGRKVYLIRGWGDTQSAEDELRALRPSLQIAQFADGEDSPVTVATLAQTRHMIFAPGSLLALLQADPILGARDFRADERAMGIFERYRQNNPDGCFIIQTARAEHPVFKAMAEGTSPCEALLADRKAFGYPPYSRIIDINLCDNNPRRLAAMSSALSKALYTVLEPSPGIGGPVQVTGPSDAPETGTVTIRVIIRRDAQFSTRRKALREAVETFASEHAYAPWIHIDVDPD